MDFYQKTGFNLNKLKFQIAYQFVDRYFDYFPESNASLEELENNILTDLDKLFVSIVSNRPYLFFDYLFWKKSRFEYMDYRGKLIVDELNYLKQLLLKFNVELSEEIITSFIDEAVDKLENHLSLNTRSYLEPENKDARRYLNYVLSGNKEEAEGFIFRLLSDGKSVYHIYQKIFMPVQYEVGNKWLKNEISVADEHLATNITISVINQLEYIFAQTPKKGKKLVATTIGRELHSMGIKFVCDFFSMDGWDTYYLGGGTPAEEILKSIDKYEPDVAAFSLTSDSSLLYLKNIIMSIKENYPNTITLVGGYVFNYNQNLIEYVKADLYAPSAEEAVKMCNDFKKQ